MAMFEDGEFDVCTLFYSEFKSVISQVPTAQQLIPANLETMRRPGPGFYEYEPDEAKFSTICCRATSVQIFGRCLKTLHPSRARACPRWTTPRAMPAR
jgi:F-type H+-transporting ATPase subunit gamma